MGKANQTIRCSGGKGPTHGEIRSIWLRETRKGLLEATEEKGKPEFWHVWDEETRQRHLTEVRVARILKREMARLKVNIKDVSFVVEPHRDFDDEPMGEGYYLHKGESPLTVILGPFGKPVKVLMELSDEERS